MPVSEAFPRAGAAAARCTERTAPPLSARGKSPPDVFPRMKTSGFRGCCAPGIASLRSSRLLIHSLLCARGLLVSLLLAATACPAAEPPAAEPAARRPPNVVVIVADDAGWGDYSFVGNTNLATPAIDSLARDGARLERFFVQPVCAPTRAEVLTGRWHPRSGVRGVSIGQERMDPAERTLAQVFRDAGHATGCFGKWHNGTQWPYHPRARGFDEFYGFTEGHWGRYFDPPLEQDPPPADGPFVRGSGYVADAIASRAVGFIERSRAAARPFFCYVAFNTPHSPMAVPEEDWARFRDRPIGLRGPQGEKEDLTFTRAALAMMENLDRNVGRILAAVDQTGGRDDTIVVYLSDNGANGPRWCGNLRGSKGTTDEGGVKSVCCIRHPARIRPGTVVREIAGAIDLLPTLAALAGVATGPTRPLDGVDLAPLLTGGEAAADAAARASGRPLFASFGGKLSVRTQTHRLDAQGRLYDMEADPGQTRDTSAENPAAAARLRDLAAAWRKDVLTAVPPPGEERFPVGAAGSPRTELPARDGLPRGGIVRSGRAPNCSFFTAWKSPADAIDWKVDVLTPGDYEAVLFYTCPAADAGSTVRLSCGGAAIEARIEPAWDPALVTNEDRVPRQQHGEGYDKDFRPLSLGTIRLAAGPATLSLAAVTMPGDSVADVRRIVLVPKR